MSLPKTRKTTRVVTVPQPMIAVATFQLPSNRPLDVVLAEDEDVEWIWSSLPCGLSYISGYKVVKKDESSGSKKP
jgi:hypothetical protein